MCVGLSVYSKVLRTGYRNSRSPEEWQAPCLHSPGKTGRQGVALLFLMVSYKCFVSGQACLHMCTASPHSWRLMYEPGPAGDASEGAPLLEVEGNQEERNQDYTEVRVKTGHPVGCCRTGKIDKEAMSRELTNFGGGNSRREGWPRTILGWISLSHWISAGNAKPRGRALWKPVKWTSLPWAAQHQFCNMTADLLIILWLPATYDSEILTLFQGCFLYKK